MKSKLLLLLAAIACMAAANGAPILLGGYDGTNAIGSPKQDAAAVGNFSFDASFSGTVINNRFNPGLFYSGGALWGTTSFATAADSSNNSNFLLADAHPVTLTFVVVNTGTENITLDALHWRAQRDRGTSPTEATITYTAGDLADTPGGSAVQTMGTAASSSNTGYDFALSGILTDLTLAAGESATFTWATNDRDDRLRLDNFAFSGEIVSTGPDTDPPTPNPMTWASDPTADGDSSISMTATAATDPSGVQYYFTNTTVGDGSHNSGWQSNSSYTDIGLSPGTTYTYTVKARDAVGLYETAASAAKSATTSTPDTSKPNPDPMTFSVAPIAVNDSSITMTATTATDDSGVEYYFDETSGNPGGTDSGWQDSTEYTDTGLDPETEYTYTVTARDRSTARNTTTPSTAESATTPAMPVGPVLLGGYDGTNAIGSPKQDASAIGNFSFDMSYSGTVVNNRFNPGTFYNGGALWGSSDFVTDADNSNSNCVLLVDIHPLTLTFVVTNTSTDQEITLDAIHWNGQRDRSTSPDEVTISYTAGDLTDPLGISAVQPMPTSSGYDFSLSGLVNDRVLYPGESATFTWTTKDMDDRFRVDNIAFSGTVRTSDYISWRSAQGWTAGEPGTGGNDDYDLDGLSNDYERLFGLDPMASSSQSPFTTPFEALAGTFSYTRRTQSLVGQEYTIWYSTDLREWNRDIAANQTPGTPANDIETVAVQINPILLNEEKLFLRVSAQDPRVFPAPELVNVVGSNTSVRLNFNQELYPLNGTNPANYTVELDGGSAATVTAASLSEDKKSVTLTLGSSLALASTYNVSFGRLTGVTGVPITGSSTGQFKTWDDDPNGIKVFIVAGQSNMVGYGHTELGAGGVAGAIGTLRYLANNNGTYPEYDYSSLLENPSDPVNSAWAARSDVKLWTRDGGSGNLGGPIRKGDLAPFQGATNGADDWFGPEYAFGQVIGDFYASDDVLIIKTAWGGHSLGGNFRPPSAVADRGGEIGSSYLEMFKNVREVLDNLDTEFPGWAVGRGYQIVGFAWHQGVSDSGEPFATEHKENLPDFIGDVRAELGEPTLPFVIATTGMLAAGAPMESFPYTSYSKVEQAQLWAAGVAQPASTLTDDTRGYWEEAADSPRDQGFHWNQNARSYFRVGLGLADKMVELLEP